MASVATYATIPQEKVAAFLDAKEKQLFTLAKRNANLAANNCKLLDENALLTEQIKELQRICGQLADENSSLHEIIRFQQLDNNRLADRVQVLSQELNLAPAEISTPPATPPTAQNRWSFAGLSLPHSLPSISIPRLPTIATLNPFNRCTSFSPVSFKPSLPSVNETEDEDTEGTLSGIDPNNEEFHVVEFSDLRVTDHQ